MNLALEIRQNQWLEADWQVQALGKTKEDVQTRKRYLENLIQRGLNSGESHYENLIAVSLGLIKTGIASEVIAQIMGFIPDMWFGNSGPFPTFDQQLPLGTKLSQTFSAGTRICNSMSQITSTTGSLRLTQAGWNRREEEWRHQVEVLGIELEQIERQILAAERRRDVALRELNNHQRQMELAAEVYDFLKKETVYKVAE